MQSRAQSGQVAGKEDNAMRNFIWLVFLAVVALESVKAKPLVSFGVSYQQPQQPYLGPGPYYNNYYGGPGPYNSGYYYGGGNAGASFYRYPYAAGNRYGALDIGIGALSLTPFLL